jgi:peptidoglycan/xylan/chitin deacetylase (PgdA/CDA1 family)
MILGLKVDVCTYDGLRLGVPNLLCLLEGYGIRASFFVALGPDTSGRAILRVFRHGFLAKMRRTRAVRTYGLRTIFSGTLLPPREVGRLVPTLRAVIAAGHELAIHGYDHRRWQDRLHQMDDRAVRGEIGRAVAAYRDVTGRAPRGFGAPGWQVTAASLRVLDELGFSYASDTRGTWPFFPRVAGQTFRTLQLPTTMPTLDEVLGLDGIDGEGFAVLVRQELERMGWGVLTFHAEMEGLRFQGVANRILACLREINTACVPLETLAERVRGEGVDKIPVAEVVHRPIRGRAGTVAMPAGLEVT